MDDFRRPRVCQTSRSGQACLAVMSSPHDQGGASPPHQLRRHKTAMQPDGTPRAHGDFLAESQGFEPWEAFKPRRFSVPL